MGSGTGSTLVIHPRGLGDLTMGLAATEPYVGSTPYIVPLQTLDFNEELRWQYVYDQTSLGEGGEAVSGYGPLVAVTFRVGIKANTRAAMIDAYNDLQAAVLNPRGGTIEYKPEDVGAGVLATFYHYVKSPPPRLMDSAGNRWDAAAKSDGKFTLWVEVEFLTQPVATSNPDSPVTLSDLAVTIQNWVDDLPSQTNRVTVQASSLKGTMPALLRLLARPGLGQYLGRLIMFRRAEGTLANFVNIYEAEDASVIYPSIGLTEVADSARGDGAYMQYRPPEDANGMAQGLRFTISNPGDHEGRFAVFGVGYDGADGTGVWTHQVRVRCGNVIQEGEDDWEAESTHSWQLVYGGEFELPAVPFSDSESGYDTGPYIEWWATRANGTSEFLLDAILLVYVSDSERQPCALDVPCEDVDGATDVAGVTNSEKLLVEDFLDSYGMIRDLAHVVAQVDGDFKRALMTAPRGDFLMLDPTVDNLLVFVQEQVGNTVILDDDFESYKGTRWLKIFAAESDDETWAGGSANTTDELEDAECRQVALTAPFQGGSYTTFDDPLDLSWDGRFTDDDFIILRWWQDAGIYVAAIEVGLHTVYNVDYFEWTLYAGNEHAKRSAASEVGSPDWAEINMGGIWTWTPSDDTNVYFDYMTIEKADPNNSAVPNATGSQWDFQPAYAKWTITEDVSGAGATLACLDVESGVEKSALIDETTPADVRFRARAMAKRDSGYVGILWRTGPDTLIVGEEDCYAALLDITNDDLWVREYNNGVPTQLDTVDFSCAVDTWYVIGVIVKEDAFQVYATAASNLSEDDDVFDNSYLLSTVTDSTHYSGKCGVMSVSTLGRFDEVQLVSLQDRLIPADEITLEGKAIFRTIAPFAE